MSAKPKRSASQKPAKASKQKPASEPAAQATAVATSPGTLDGLDPTDFWQPSEQLAGSFSATAKRFHDLGAFCVVCSWPLTDVLTTTCPVHSQADGA